MPQEVEAYLRGIPGSDRTRAVAFDAVYNAPDELTAMNLLRDLPYPQEVKAVLWDYRTKAVQAPPEAPDGNRWVRDTLGAAAETLNPMRAMGALKQAITPPDAGGIGLQQTVNNVLDASMGQGRLAGEAVRQGRPLEAAGRALATVPLIGPAAAHAGERIGSGDVTGGLGEGLALVAGGGLAGPTTRAVGRAVQAPAQAVGRRVYQSVLKPTKATLNDVRPSGGRTAQQTLLQTGLDEGVPITTRGLQKVETLIDSLDAEVKARVRQIQASGEKVDPALVDQAIDDVVRDFAQQVNAQPDLSAIEAVRRNFQTNPNVAQPVAPATPANFAAGQISGTPARTQPGPIDPVVAQQMKTNTYQGLRGKYGRELSGTIEAEKAGARGLREGIEQAGQRAGVDDISAVNAREGALISLEHALTDALRRRGNYDVLGLKTAIGATASAASESTLPLLVTLVDRFPGLVSRAGIWINRTGTRSGRRTQEAARATATANVTSPSESQTRTRGLRPATP